MGQSAHLVVNPIMVYLVGQASDDVKISSVGWCLGQPWLNLRFSLALSVSRGAFSLFHHSV